MLRLQVRIGSAVT